MPSAVGRGRSRMRSRSVRTRCASISPARRVSELAIRHPQHLPLPRSLREQVDITGTSFSFLFPKASTLEISLAGFRRERSSSDLLACDSRKNSLKIRSVEAILAHQSLNPIQQTLFRVLDPIVRPWWRRKLRVENRDKSSHRPA